jgi:ribosomal protein L7Ae-like RNA K-turn-binding protein
VLGSAGRVVPDLAGKAFGRGAWVHPTPACLGKAAPRGLSRSFRCQVTTSATELWLTFRAAADRRIEGLLGAAERAGRLAVGSSLARDAFEAGHARLVLVATDARAAADAAWVYEAVRRGIGLAWGKKAVLGHALGREEVAVAAVLDEGIAQALSFVVGVAELPPPAESPKNVLADSSTEDG